MSVINPYRYTGEVPTEGLPSAEDQAYDEEMQRQAIEEGYPPSPLDPEIAALVESMTHGGGPAHPLRAAKKDDGERGV